MRGLFRNRRNGVYLDGELQHHMAKSRLPWIESPLKGAGGDDHDSLAFAQRHEASPLELFFDLVFVANLATFTSYHSITDASALYAYMGFFAIIWTSWFQITLHDVRFARDSVYERTCKVVQFIVFVGFALVGSGFTPSGNTTDVDTNMMFQVLSVTLFISRFLFVIQYSVVLIWVARKRQHELYLPLCLNIFTYIITGGVFAVTATAFSAKPGAALYSVGYFILCFEAFGTMTISCIWRSLGFHKTHLIERMGLLTLIVIGEGAIGVTKTISKLLGKGPDLQLSGLIFCIILIVFFIWMLYFDNRPHGPFGPIRQQIWSLLHFPLHIAIVGVVEGSQQMALARYVLMQSNALDQTIFTYCMEYHVTGAELMQLLSKLLKPFKLDKKAESMRYVPAIQGYLDVIGNNTDICATSMTDFMALYRDRQYPAPLKGLYDEVLSALYSSVSVSPPKDVDAIEIAYTAWQVVYNYYWASMALTFITLAVLQIIMGREKRTRGYYYISIGSRLMITFIPLIFVVAASRNHSWMYAFIGSSLVVPAVVLIHLAVVLSDGFASMCLDARQRRNDLVMVLEEKKGGEMWCRGE